jgi:hypothetical protein
MTGRADEAMKEHDLKIRIYKKISLTFRRDTYHQFKFVKAMSTTSACCKT